jgi:glutamyl-tRNA synthetase
MTIGRFAPSPTGALHLGNFRTAVAAQWMSSDRMVIRIEDLDRVTSRREWASAQMSDLRALGITSDVDVVYQSDRFHLYEEYLNRLTSKGLTYQCFCTRKEIRDSATAPHDFNLRYPGTCRDLAESERRARAEVRPPSIRLRVDDTTRNVGEIDDIVLRRNDGVPAYNLAVVVDDELQGVTQVVRGIDLKQVTPSQQYLQRILGFRELEYVHVGLVVGPDGERLAKRHGAVTLADWLGSGRSASGLRRALERTLADRPIEASCPIEDIWAAA